MQAIANAISLDKPIMRKWKSI